MVFLDQKHKHAFFDCGLHIYKSKSIKKNTLKLPKDLRNGIL